MIATLAPVLALACQSAPASQSLEASPPPALHGFDAERAWADLNALTGIGPRVMATEGSERARAYLRAELEKLGLEIVEQRFMIQTGRGEAQDPGLVMQNLVAAIPGTSSDVIALMTPYDTREYDDFPFVGANDGGSGAAVVLELARVLSRNPLPYTVWVAFLEGEAHLGSERDGGARSYFGSSALARRLRDLEAFDQVRLAVTLERVCDADLRIARDLQSERRYRADFWQAAERLGHGDAFPRAVPYESPQASHQALLSEGFRDVVALVDTSFGGGEPPGLYAGTEADNPEHCSPDSLAAVGEVVLEALDRIGLRMARIDRASKSSSDGAKPLRLEQLQVLRAARSSNYNGHVRILDLEGYRRLVSGPEGSAILQSSMDLAEPERLVDPYTQIASILMSLHPAPKRVFNIGLGGGVIPRFHLQRYPESEVQSVEIDPVVIALAKEFFGVVHPRHTILEGDGAAALRSSEGRFDVIVVDAYTDREGIPEVFAGRTFIDALPAKLDSGGIVVANLYAKKPAAFEKLVADYKRNFSHGVRVTIPRSVNHMVAVGDFQGLTCTAFQETLQLWSSQGLLDLEWTEQNAPTACTDL